MNKFYLYGVFDGDTCLHISLTNSFYSKTMDLEKHINLFNNGDDAGTHTVMYLSKFNWNKLDKEILGIYTDPEKALKDETASILYEKPKGNRKPNTIKRKVDARIGQLRKAQVCPISAYLDMGFSYQSGYEFYLKILENTTILQDMAYMNPLHNKIKWFVKQHNIIFPTSPIMLPEYS